VDSAAYVLSSISSKNLRGDQEPPRSNRLVWALLLALITAGLIVAGEIKTIQAATIVSALPLVPIVILMCASLLKWLKEDFPSLNEKHILVLEDQN
jgi:BCCT family betaine/carnitine transporter